MMSALHVTIENLSHRGFLRGMPASGGLVIAAKFLAAERALAYPTGAAEMPGGVVSDPHFFVAIAGDGTITIIAHRAEMGTGTRTSLPMAVADELEVDWPRVRVKQSPGDQKIRQPKHRRLPQPARFYPADAAMRSRRAAGTAARPCRIQ